MRINALMRIRRAALSAALVVALTEAVGGIATASPNHDPQLGHGTEMLDSVWPRWADDPEVTSVAGDFNGDGFDDLALLGAPYFTTQPVAFSNGDGTFRVTNFSISGSWPRWADDVEVAPVAGDFNGDGRDDLALLGAPYFTTQPVAFSRGDGTFWISNLLIAGDWPRWADDFKVEPVVGDFNGDGRDDLALLGAPYFTTQPVAFSNGDGTFRVTNFPITGDWPRWADDVEVVPVGGDFNGDTVDDLALLGAPYFTTQPVAFSLTDGTFFVSNLPIA